MSVPEIIATATFWPTLGTVIVAGLKYADRRHLRRREGVETDALRRRLQEGGGG